MKLINIPVNFNELSLKAKFDILIEEYFDEFSIAKIADQTFETNIIPLLDKEFEAGAKLSIQEVIRKVISEAIVEHMDNWYVTNVFESVDELRIYFDLNQLTPDQELIQVEFLRSCGQGIYSYVYQICRNKAFNSYVSRRNVKDYIQAVYGINTDKIKFDL